MLPRVARVATSLRAARVARGLSREALARQAGITRQAYGPLEDGKATPATDVALRLARALGTTVEALFRLPEEGAPLVEAEWAGPPGSASSGGAVGPTRVRLCRVGGRIFARPLAGGAPRGLLRADGLAYPNALAPGGGVTVRLLPEAAAVDRPAVAVLGCDPAVVLLADGLALSRGVEVVWTESGSKAALSGLARGEAHVAGCHLLDEATGVYNRPWVDRLVPFPCVLVAFAVWEQGLILRPGTPFGVRRVADLARPGLRFVNREAGSGTRALLDTHLRLAGVPASAVAGYDAELHGHLAVAEAVASGLADVGVGVRAAALAYGLDFVPLGEERYDLVVPRHFLDLPAVRAFLDHLTRPGLRAQVEALGGYDVAAMGVPA